MEEENEGEEDAWLPITKGGHDLYGPFETIGRDVEI